MRLPIRLLLSAGTLGALALAWHAYDAAKRPAQPVAQEIPRELARVASETQLSADESLRLVVVAHPLGKHFDMRCLLYVNKELRTSHLVCPDGRQDQLEERDMDGTPRGAR